MISVQELRRIIDYDPETGKFTRKVRTANCIQAGQEAGFIDHKGYRTIKVGGKAQSGQRIAWAIMTGEWPTHLVDHIDGNPANNVWANLRKANHQQNAANRVGRRGLKGTTRLPSGRYQAQIKSLGKTSHIGVFDTEDEAHQAYMAKARELHGEYARAA